MPVGAAIGISGALGAGASIYGSTTAANAQTNAANNAISAQQQMFNQAKNIQQPFLQAGQDAWGILNPMLGIGGPSVAGGGATGPGNGPGATDIYGQPVQSGFGTLTNPFQPTMEQLSSTPGYQFALQQGQQAVTNSNAAKGLGSSGAALRGAADYAQGLASTTFQQQQQNYQGQQQQIYNMLYQPTQLGANAANSLTGAATQTGQGIANSYGYMGNAQAAGANAIGAAGSGLANSIAGGLLYSSMSPQTQGNNQSLNNAIWQGGQLGQSSFGSGASPIPYLNYYQPFSGSP